MGQGAIVASSCCWEVGARGKRRIVISSFLSSASTDGDGMTRIPNVFFRPLCLALVCLIRRLRPGLGTDQKPRRPVGHPLCGPL